MSTAIRLMGEFYVGDSPVEQSLKGRKNQAILAYLAHHLGEPVDRDVLTRLLWPEDEPTAAKASLRQALATVRRALPDGAIAMQGRLPSLNPKKMSVDVSLHAPFPLEQFGGIVRGPWLDGFSVQSAAFEAWLSGERASVHSEITQRLRDYALSLKAEGRYENALEVLQRALWLDDTSELLYRETIELHRQLGHTVEAMQVFQAASEVMAKKLSVEPSNALKELVADIEVALLVSVLMWHGELDQALQHCQTIVDGLDPELSTGPGELRPRALLGNLHMLQGRYEEALSYAERDLDENPSNYFAHVNLANVLGYLGQADAAQQAWLDAQAIVPDLSVELFHRGYQGVCTDASVADGFVNGLIAAGIQDA